MARPARPCRRIYRLSLIGGGQIRVTEKFVWCRHHDTGEIDNLLGPTWQEDDPKLSIIPHLADGIVRATGLWKSTEYYESDHSAVVLFHGGDQALADRVAATLRLIKEHDNFFALLDGSTGCAICGRPLRDEVSKLINIGPECARKINRPHNLKAASEIVRRRRELLAGAGQRATLFLSQSSHGDGTWHLAFWRLRRMPSTAAHTRRYRASLPFRMRL